ncbi:MAG: hypothetical protein ABEJ84_06535 [Halodesulfurarchaeum sp.]
MKVKHTQDPGITGRLKAQAETVKEGLVGVPLWPEQAVIMAGVFFTYATAVTLLAALVPVHPVELYGPSVPGTPHVKPDWYLIWIYGILRVMPPIDIGILGASINARFIAGAVVPGIIGGMLASVPLVDTLLTGDSVEDPDATRIQHPFDRPGRTAIGVGAILFFVLGGVAGYYTELGLGTTLMRALLIVGPLLGGGLTYGALARRNGN